MLSSISFLIEALTQIGKPYRFGVEVSARDPEPTAFDCSELVEWAAARAGVIIPDGSGNQIAHVEAKGTMIPLHRALTTPGALLLRRPRGAAPGHVAISLGDGRTVEAMDTAHGVCVGDGRRPGFDLGALVPGLDYTEGA